MKIYKKLAGALAMGMIMTGSFSALYAQENEASKMSGVYGFKDPSGIMVRRTTEPVYTQNNAPTIGTLRTTKIDSKLCLIVHVEDNSGVSRVEIDNRTATRRNGDIYAADYYIELATSGSHTIYAEDMQGKNRTESQSVTVNDNTKPTVDLSQTFKNGNCYLVIKAEDNTGIASVTVNGSSISFDTDGGTENYRVTQSKTYTVVVKDVAGNTTTEKYDVEVETDKPSLTVDKTLKNGKWYLTIKASPRNNANISKVTVNNTKISFRSSGDTVDYAVPSTGNYTVVVTDSYNQEASQTINVDTGVTSDSYKPTLNVTQKNVGGVICLVITTQASNNVSNNRLSKVSVNGISVSVPANGGTAEYPVATTGNYTVVSTDINGNQAIQNIYVNVPGVQTTPQTPVNNNYTNNSTSGSGQVVFTLNKTTWTKGGVYQTTMDAAPIAKYGRIYIPIRYVAYALGIDASKVTWNASTKSAVIYDGSNTITVPLNSKVMKVNGTSQTMEAAAISYNQRIYIPISQVAKAFSNVNMNWNNTQKQITISRG